MNTSDNQLNVKNSIRIEATADRVWDALTNPEQTKKYMFGCETVSDWQVELDCKNIVAGTYHYTLIVNSTIIDTKTMVVAGNN